MADAEPGAVSRETYFNQVYETHRQGLHAFLFGRSGSPEVALDLLQEVFLRAWRNLHTLQAMPPAQHRYWLFTVARNLLADHYRRQATRSAGEAELQQNPCTGIASQAPDAQLIQEEEIRRVDAAIQQLPEDLRTVLVMRVLGELTSAEIGATLDKPAGTVRYQLHRARKQLAEAIQLMENDQAAER